MIRKSLVLATMLIGTLLTGCASMQYSEEVQTPIVEVAKPANDEAAIVFYRPSILGAAVSSPIAATDDEGNYRLVAVVNSFQNVIEKAAPGKHTFVVGGEGQNMLVANVEAGKVYIVRVRPMMGLWKARFELKPVTGPEITPSIIDDIKGTKVIKPNESAIKEVQPRMQSKVREALAGNTNRDPLVINPEDGITYEQFEALMNAPAK